MFLFEEYFELVTRKISNVDNDTLLCAVDLMISVNSEKDKDFEDFDLSILK